MSQSESLSDMSARQVSDGAEVMLSIENRIVFVKKQMRVGSRTLRSRRPDLVSKKNQQKIDIDGSVYETKTDEEADLFVAAAQLAAEQHQYRLVDVPTIPAALTTPLSLDNERWQYAVINLGLFDTAERMASVLGMSGQAGWELVTIFDKSSNWFVGMEKGFMLLGRRVPAGVEPDEWAIQYRA